MRSRTTEVFLLALALAGCGDGNAGHVAPPATGSGFVEWAEPAGIDFRMAFLPDEQGRGTAFKINLYDHGCGVAVADIDGDGDDDLYFLNELGSNALYRNGGDGRFTNVTAEAGPVALPDRICTSAAFNDYDNDGDQDLFVTSTRGGNALFDNDGRGHFTEVTKRADLTWVGHSQGCTFFDADNDGDLDLVVTNTARWTTDAYNAKEKYYGGVGSLMELIDSPIEHNLYYRNNGDGTFTKATQEAGLAGVGWGGDLAAFDYDGDGDLDLFIGNMFGQSVLYANDGHGKFTNVTDKVLGATPWGTVAAKAFDYDGDGLLDLYVIDMHSDMWVPFEYDLSKVEAERKYPRFFGALAEKADFPAWQEELFAETTHIDYDKVFFGNGLFRNRGDGTFEEVSAKAHAETFWPWGIGAGDFDNDGYVDVYLASGMGFPWEFWPCALLMNNGDGTFTGRGRAEGIDPPPGGPVRGQIDGRDAVRSSRSAATADFDGDGRVDLVVNNFDDRPYYYLNRFPARSWVGFRLQGTSCNRDAIGALVRLKAGGRTQVRQVHAAGGYLSQSSKTLYFGLGDAQAVDACEIRWPDGQVQTLPPPATGRVHEVTEPAR